MAWATLKKTARTIGAYEILEKIAEGGSGAVHKGRHAMTGAIVAIKVRPLELLANPTQFKRFEQEFRAASKLDHPNLVRALDFGQDDTSVYLVMEFVEGESLGDRIARGRLPEAEAVRMITQVAQALHYAHRHGIIHRDVKPDNILLRADGQVKLTDLGLIKDAEGAQDLTRPATGLGTPHFIAPEQFADAKHADVRCDVYGLGATLYMAVTGQLPFGSCGCLTALKKKLAGDLPPPQQLVATLSEPVDAAIRRAMSPEPARRPASCLEFVKDLTRKSRRRKPAAPGEEVSAPAAPLPAVPAAEGERRVSIRLPCSLGTACILEASFHAGSLKAEDLWPATVHNLSTRGIGLLLGRRFEPETVLAVELEASDPRWSRPRMARVKRVVPDGLGHWFLGCAFLEPLSMEELQGLL